MIDFIIAVLTIACLIPIMLAAAGRISWRNATIQAPIYLFVLYFGYYWIGQYVNILWFNSLGYGAVFWTIFSTKWTGFIITFLACFAFYEINAWAMRRLTKSESNLLLPILSIVFGIAALMQAVVTYGSWNTILLNANGGQFGIQDPIFAKDIGFYIFNLPFLQLVAGMSFWTCLVAMVVLGITYAILHNIEGFHATSIISHLCSLATVGIGLFIWLRVLGAYGYMYGTTGVVIGGYTDISKITLNWIFIAICSIAILLMLVGAVVRRWRLAVGSISIMLVMGVILMGIIPAITQGFIVKPNEFDKEQKYIGYNIDYTQKGYDLDKFNEKEVQVAALTPDVAAKNQPTLSNVRVWDWRALSDTFNQLQLFRTYYTFPDVDIDRYAINGEYRQVMLSAREIDQSLLSEKTWINQHFIYTHGYGVVMNEVNQYAQNGEPLFIIKDIPPVSTAKELQVKQPRIYFGNLTNSFIVTNAGTDEFDYPNGDTNSFTRYDGADGVKIDSLGKRLAFATSFNDFSILISGQITDDSKMSWQRNVKDRIGMLVPFLSLDTDDYIVVRNDGSLAWMQDCFTTSTMYPYSKPMYGDANYIRNSVKATIDAYNGSINFYIYDKSDPIVQAYARAFPTLFKAQTDMPKDLVAHVRYPEDYFVAQTNAYKTYHMKDAQVFYNKEDVWDTGKEVFDSGPQYLIPYFVMVQLPDSPSTGEFIEMLPFTPLGKDNMIAWIASECDGSNYGKMLVYKFSKQQLIYGPLQVEAKINQDETMASQFTLWTKSSTVIRGDTLVIPTGDAIIYISPVYLKSAEATMPQIVRVIVGSLVNTDAGADLKLAWDKSFDSALGDLIGAAPPAPVSEVQPPAQSPTVTMQDVINQLNKLSQEFGQMKDSIDALIKSMGEAPK